MLQLARLGPQVHTDKILQSLSLGFECPPTNREKGPTSGPCKSWVGGLRESSRASWPDKARKRCRRDGILHPDQPDFGKNPTSPYKMWNLNKLSHQPDIFHFRHMNLGECNLKDDTALKSCIRDEQNGGLSPIESTFEFYSRIWNFV